ncbi:MAG TPA: hypothetical protein VMV29_09350 [Ktedonobacterales bacterium]|nr:hypothetical protein [Ktedonobacterales bacterium]
MERQRDGEYLDTQPAYPTTRAPGRSSPGYAAPRAPRYDYNVGAPQDGLDTLDTVDTVDTPVAPGSHDANTPTAPTQRAVAPITQRRPGGVATRANSQSRALAPLSSLPPGAPVIVPARQTRPVRSAANARWFARAEVIWRWYRPIIFLMIIVVALTAILSLNTGRTLAPIALATPPPSGQGPFTASANALVIPPPPPTAVPTSSAQGSNGSGGTYGSGGGFASSLEPCKDSYQFVPNISQWTTPPGCYANIYVPNPANYPYEPSFGYCNWWVEVTHANYPDITWNTSYPRGLTPVAGDPIYFDGGEQGADAAGHWAQAVAVDSNNYWVLISEMNFSWRGGGFGRIDYRYIHVGPHVHFVYVKSNG